jgi:hypothetical protein
VDGNQVKGSDATEAVARDDTFPGLPILGPVTFELPRSITGCSVLRAQ